MDTVTGCRCRRAARGACAITAGVILAVILSACAAVPQSVHRDVALVSIERDGEAVADAADITSVDTRDGTSYAFSDEQVAFLVRFDQNFVDVRLENLTSEALQVLLDDSAFIDANRNAHDLAALGSLFESSARGERKVLVPPGTRRDLRLSMATGSTAIGFTRPLFPIDRHGRTASLKQAEDQLGGTVAVMLQLQHQGAEPMYRLSGQLQRVRVGETWVE